MSRSQVLQLVIAVSLVMSFLIGCGSTTPTPVPEVPVAATTQDPAAATPTPEPSTATPQSPTATPTSTASVVKGKLIGADSQQPLAGGAVLLCLVSAETQCTLKTDLTATVQENGSFELANVSPGQYVVLYEPSGKFEATWKDLDGLTLDYKLTNNDFSKEFQTTFGADGLGRHNLTIGPKGIQSGAVSSLKYGLILEFKEGKPITITVEQGEPIEIEIMALESPIPSSAPEPSTETTAPTNAQAEPGAVFNGDLEISEAGSDGTAGSGTITVIISEDGTAIDFVAIFLDDVKCPNSELESLTLTFFDTPSPIDEGNIETTASSQGEQTITGQLISPTEMRGTATILSDPPLEEPCDLGTWNWSAKVE